MTNLEERIHNQANDWFTILKGRVPLETLRHIIGVTIYNEQNYLFNQAYGHIHSANEEFKRNNFFETVV